MHHKTRGKLLAKAVMHLEVARTALRELADIVEALRQDGSVSLAASVGSGQCAVCTQPAALDVDGVCERCVEDPLWATRAGLVKPATLREAVVRVMNAEPQRRFSVAEVCAELEGLLFDYDPDTVQNELRRMVKEQYIRRLSHNAYASIQHPPTPEAA